MKRRFINVFLCAAMMILNANIINAAARDYDFSDVSQSHWAYDTIMQLSDGNVISGFDDNTFRPDDNVTREQFIKLLVCVVDDVDDNAQTYNISDITTDVWSYVYLASADEAGIINYDDYQNGFNPQGLMDRATAVKWISKSINVSGGDIKTGIFNDITSAETDAYASELNSYGIINGYEDGSFRPNNPLSRAEAATVIKNISDYLSTWEISGEEKEIIEYADNVLALDASRKTNLLSKNSEESCEITNADSDITSLKTGDILVVPNCKEAPGGMAVKVKNISVSGKTATIKKDKNIDIDEVFEKIDINKSTYLAPQDIITDKLPKGVTVKNTSYSLMDINNSLSLASLGNVADAVEFDAENNRFTVNLSNGYESNGVSAEGDIEISVSVNPDIKYDKASGGFLKGLNATVDANVDILSKLTVKATGETDDIELLEIPFKKSFVAFTLYGSISLKVDVSGEIYAVVSCDIHDSGTLKYCPSQNSMPRYRNTDFSVNPNMEAEMSVTVTPKIVVKAGVAILGSDDDSSVYALFLEPEVGVNVTAAINSKAQTHVHHPCIDIRMNPHIAIGAGASVNGQDVKNWDLWEKDDFSPYRFYAGLADKWEFGKGICPYMVNVNGLNNTYTTHPAQKVTSPKFEFDYSDNWTITTEEYSPTNAMMEKVILTSSSGSRIAYINFSDSLGASGRDISQHEITRIADSQFTPSYAAGTDTDFSYLGNFMVGKVTAVGNYDRKTGELVPVERDVKSAYAVMPESYIGMHDTQGVDGLMSAMSFKYPTNYLFAADPADGATDEEINEIIQILSSFRVVN